MKTRKILGILILAGIMLTSIYCIILIAGLIEFLKLLIIACILVAVIILALTLIFD